MSYKSLIIEATKCKPKDINDIEETMRGINHSTLDWLSREEFIKLAQEAFEVVHEIRLEAKAYRRMRSWERKFERNFQKK